MLLVVFVLAGCLAGLGVTAAAESEIHGPLDTVSVNGTAGQDSTSSNARILDLYPNPPTYGDVGEFVTIRFPPGANVSQYELTDGHSRVRLEQTGPQHDTTHEKSQDVTLQSSPVRGAPLGLDREWTAVTFSTAPNKTRDLTDRRVAPLPDNIQLADDGDTVRLEREGVPVDESSYERATAGEVYDAVSGDWYALGATDRPVVTAAGGTVEAFVLPDAPDRAVELLEGADDRILLAGYTLSSGQVVDALVDAHERGVTVEVLVDGRPVGGMPAPAAASLDRLDREGVTVEVIGGERDRYRFHHAKYAIVDESALVTSENWKPAGTGGQSSRGWGVVTNQSSIVGGLTRTFEADTGWVDSIPWDEFDDKTLVEGGAARGTYPETFGLATVDVDGVDLLVAPDNANQEILSLLNGAEEQIDIKQVQISDTQFPFMQAAIGAARRGVEVRILLSGEWYVADENQAFVDRLNEKAEQQGLPLSARIAQPDGAYEKIHAKGVIVDGERTLVGSINWNNNSVQNNREVAVVLHGEEPAAYFGAVFEADWEGEDREVPLGLVLAGVGGATVAVLGARRIQWES